MFDLNRAIQQWRTALGAQGGLTANDQEELEDHLREAVAELQATGLNEEEAFLVASRRLGKPEDLGPEFAIADPEGRRRFRLRWMVIGALALVFLWLASGFLIGLTAGTMNWVVGGQSIFPLVSSGLMIGVSRLVLLLVGVVLIWKLLASDLSSRKLSAMGVGSMILALLILAFLVLVTRMGAGFVMARSFSQEGMMHWYVVNGWVSLILQILLPGVLLVGLWRLVRS
jgi:hypothetical protein|nr:permease prefix domain 1-containing protein [Candidatus Krumholzibacteria bacterium]